MAESSKGGATYGGLRLSAESLKSLYICLAYGCSSILISLIYKALLRCVLCCLHMRRVEEGVKHGGGRQCLPG